MALVKVPKFLRALYTMLHDEDRRVLAWSADGTCFQVHDVARLEREVLPKYFKHSRLASFQRQLNNFGFRKWTKTRANVCTFSHDVLVQCHPSDLSDLMARFAESRELSSAAATGVASPRTLKRQRSFESPRVCDGRLLKRANMRRGAMCTGASVADAVGSLTRASYDAFAASAWVFDSIDVADVCALDWSRGLTEAQAGADLLLEPLAMETACEPIDWELAADCLAVMDSDFVVSAVARPDCAYSIWTSC